MLQCPRFQHVEITYDSPGRWPGFSLGKETAPARVMHQGRSTTNLRWLLRRLWQSRQALHGRGLDLDTAIRLRWALRDIKAKRTKLTPVSPSDLKTLIDMGLTEMRDDAPLLTSQGYQAVDQ
jgi:hypothetical protein